MNLGHRPDGTPHERWIASGAALDSAIEWTADNDWHDPDDADLLDNYLATTQADEDFDEWCRQQILEHLADMRDEARQRGAAL